MKDGSIAAEAEAAEAAVNRARAEGTASTLIDAAQAAAAGIENLGIGPASTASGEEREALVAMKRFLFNAAADCWPGWEPGPPSVGAAELRAARELATRSRRLVRELGLGPIEEGNADWLVGAFDLALRFFDAALAEFTRAATMYERGSDPALALLARGYCAIALEAAGRPAAPGLPSVLEELGAGAFAEGAAFSDQLKTARKAFV